MVAASLNMDVDLVWGIPDWGRLQQPAGTHKRQGGHKIGWARFRHPLNHRELVLVVG